MPKPIMNLDEVAFDDVEENGAYTSSRGSIGRHIGAQKLGYNLTVLPPGKVQCLFNCRLLRPRPAVSEGSLPERPWRARRALAGAISGRFGGSCQACLPSQTATPLCASR